MANQPPDPNAGHKGFFGPQSVWLGLAVLAVMLFGWQAMQPGPDPDKPPVAVRNVRVGVDMQLQELTRADCLALPDRVWVTLPDTSRGGRGGVECISYVVSETGRSGAEMAIVFLEGDVPEADIAEQSQDGARGPYQRRADALAAEYKLPVIVIGRPGIMGSSGFHILGGQRDEGQVIDAALDQIKQKVGFRTVALAGQSGGARIIAQLMILGRTDIACAAMGSGAYDVPGLRGGGRTMTNIYGDPGQRFLVPLRGASEIPRSSSRRSFVIGDPKDTVAAFSEQKEWADKLGSLGHHVQLIEAEGRGPGHHGLSREALIAAAMCATGRSDPEIASAVRSAGRP